MNGFIFNDQKSLTHAGVADRIAPMTEGVKTSVSSLGGASLLSWGGENGDVHVASRGSESQLVLLGYVAEIGGAKTFRSQAEATQTLLSMLDGANSDEEIGKICQRLFGSFGLIYRDTARKRLICISDRVGSRPVWKCRDGAGWFVSSHTMAIVLATGSPRLDATALSAFLLYGGAIKPTRSLFAGVDAIAPGTILHLNENGSTSQHRWYQFQHKPDQERSVRGWVDFASERLIQAAARLVQADKSPAIFFSGGVDSRLTVAAMKAAGGNPLLVTLGDSVNLEVRVAQAAAKAMKLRHEVILRDTQWYLRAFPRAVYEAGGSYVFTHGHFSAAATQARDRFGSDAFFLGDLCEAFSKLFCSQDGVDGQKWTPTQFAEAFDSIRLPLYRPDDRTGTLSLLKAGVRGEVEGLLRKEILERYSDMSGVSEEPLIVGDHCFRWESAPTLPTFYMFSDVRAAAAERSIMFDAGVHELLETLPAKMREGLNMGAKLIYKMHPLAAWVPNSNSLLPMCWPPAAHKMSRKIKPYLGKLRRAMIGDSHRTTGSWPKHAALYLTQPEWRRKFEDTILNGDLFDRDLFDRDAVRGCWRAFVGGDARRSGDVEKLAQLGQMSVLLKSGGTKYFSGKA